MTSPQYALEFGLCLAMLVSGSFLVLGESKARSPFEIANALYEQGKYQEAERSFRAVLGQPLDIATRGKVTFNLGLTLQKLKRYDEAIKLFEHVLSQPVNDLEPGSHLMEPYRNYRPRAQWEIGNCLFARKDYQGALDAYRATKQKYPFQSWCGNAKAEYEYRYEYFEGLCFDHLGQTVDALKHYYRAAFCSRMFYSEPEVHFRIVGIYEQAAELPRLRKLLDDIDRQLLAVARKQAAEQNITVREEELQKFRPTLMMRRILELRSWGQEGRRGELIKLLKIGSAVTGPPDDGNWEAIEVARILALTPKPSVQDLLAAAERTPDPDVRWVGYALGRCGGPEALAWLKARAAAEENCWAKASYFFALRQTAAGCEILKQLDHAGMRVDLTPADHTEQFPKQRAGVRLPESVRELE